ncbi:MAG: hypothetical protein NVS3B14_01620 [Ktedonobacteraceae bacterium]
MTIWETITWDVARAGGFTAFGLLTVSVAIGLALTLHMQTPRWPRIINSELHNFLTLLALIFTGVHILAVWIDPFTNFGWNEVFIPFVSHYRPLWMALGIVAFYIGLAIGLSTWLRPHIGYKLWRSLHVFTLLLFALVVVHGIATGSDTRTWWGALIYASSILLVGTLLWMRLRKPANAQSRAHPVLALTMVVVVAIGTFWAMLGPFQAGWNAVANNGKGSGSTSSALAASAQQQGASSQKSTLPQSFTGDLQGQYTQNGPDTKGNVTLQFNMSISNGPAGNVQVMLQGQSGGGDDGGMTINSSNISLLSSSGQQLYSGALSNISDERRLYLSGTLTGTGANSGRQLQVQITLRIYSSGQVTGTITAGSSQPGGTPVGSGFTE